jgi:hypothetical protein
MQNLKGAAQAALFYGLIVAFAAARSKFQTSHKTSSDRNITLFGRLLLCLLPFIARSGTNPAD